MLITQQRELLAGVLIGTDGTDMRQVLSTGSLPDVGSHVLLHLRYGYLFVVAQSHSPTAV